MNLSSNAIEIPFTDKYFEPMPDRSSLMGNQSGLIEALKEDGFLWIRGALDREKVLDIREQYLSMFPHSYLKGSPRDGVWSGVKPNIPSHGYQWHPAFHMVRTEEYKAFAGSEELLDITGTLFGKKSKGVRRRPLRSFHKCRVASRAHVDLVFADRGHEGFLTAWIPLGDVAVGGGGLCYLAGSHKLDADQVRDALGGAKDRPWDYRPLSSDLAAVSEYTGLKWSMPDYQAGDIVLHLSKNIHASVDNSKDEIRVSTDVRFLPEGAEVDPRWLDDWRGDDGY